MRSRNGGMRNLSMKKFGTPIVAGPGWASEKLGLSTVGVPSGLRALALRSSRCAPRSSTFLAPSRVLGLRTGALFGSTGVMVWPGVVGVVGLVGFVGLLGLDGLEGFEGLDCWPGRAGTVGWTPMEGT